VGLSLACNILDNVDRAIKYGKTIREIYASTSGLPNQLQLLDDAAQSMSEYEEFCSQPPFPKLEEKSSDK